MKQPVFFNTLGRRLEPLEPMTPGKIRMYTCGPTVYDRAHIGNLRTFLFEDLLKRSLRFMGFEVLQVMNLTDVDDRTIDRARETGQTLDEVTAPVTKAFFADLDVLHVDRADHYPCATEHIPEMISLIEKLQKNGFAYETEGSVFFRLTADKDYGRLSGFDMAQIQQGERVVSDNYDKEDVRDFVLWKAAKPEEPSWDSPWGPGRPGWHIECSAMSMKYLGETFDIHCGGVDNIFPHHENEIAQSESATGKPFVKMWIHSEYLTVDGTKMSKSLGNFYTLGDLMEKGVSPRAFRYLMLSVHYRDKLNFSLDAMKAANGALRRVDEMRFRLMHAMEAETGEPVLKAAAERAVESFGAALANDLNASEALAALFGFVREVNTAIDAGQIQRGDRRLVVDVLANLDTVFGVFDPEAWSAETADDGLSDEEIERMMDEREQARADRNWALADEIRDQLQGGGVVLEDGRDGTRWKRQ